MSEYLSPSLVSVIFDILDPKENTMPKGKGYDYGKMSPKPAKPSNDKDKGKSGKSSGRKK